MKTKATPSRESADVANLSAFRALKLQSPSSTPPEFRSDRESVTRNALLGELDSRGSPVIAYAAVLMSENGDITLSAAGIEPEFAPAILSGLTRIHDRIDERTSRRRRRNQAGFVQLIPLVSAAILAATYINVVPWMDVALSVAGQLLAGVAVMRRDRMHASIQDK
ncbi:MULTISPECIES: hypothetical protein [Burkholderia cepacia complex]|uniref:Uncharacterized protein n=1 Tax=Burkholderia cepacia TaxID=292 RepID=A0A6N4JSK5_BURCE|nr:MULTISPECIES: hypothetical protein [Burkholderia cepacia complex]MBA9902338.1 hypothetical protein [Burkholderia cepacia]MBA9949273.1 hypothetical protein [Burkholderia cepacia]MBA9979573.1 hypothetical protein [Burkholderia cepacia]MBA9998396.1 hypothetical protein [Burkholderia cepacia]MBB0006351.1 hypothetical protein [Burkholderia cepacia]